MSGGLDGKRISQGSYCTGTGLRIHFQEKPRDLQIGLGYAIAVGTVLLYFGVGTFLAVFLVFIIPGYLFVAMLFPSDEEIDWIERGRGCWCHTHDPSADSGMLRVDTLPGKGPCPRTFPDPCPSARCLANRRTSW